MTTRKQKGSEFPRKEQIIRGILHKATVCPDPHCYVCRVDLDQLVEEAQEEVWSVIEKLLERGMVIKYSKPYFCITPKGNGGGKGQRTLRKLVEETLKWLK